MRPYRQDPKAWVGYVFLIGFGVLMMVVALLPHPNGFTGRLGRYIPLEEVVIYRWFFGLGAIVIWGMVGLDVYRRRE